MRVQKVIEKHHFTEIIVPQKFFYKHKGEWLVIAQELTLDENSVVKKAAWSPFSHKPKTVKPLTPKQAYETAVICFEANTSDIQIVNLNYTQAGKVAILDTEPMDRESKKGKWARRFFILPGIKSTLKFIQNDTNAVRLAHCCTDPKAAHEVEKVRRVQLLKEVAKKVTEAALPILASWGLFLLGTTTLNPLLTSFAVAGIVVSAANALLQGINIIAIVGFRIFSHTNLGQQVCRIE